MPWTTVIDAIAFIRDTGNDSISIGGGEPTLHPRFFDILRAALEDFDYVWMATNGSKLSVMRRLADIIDGTDFPEEDDDYSSSAIYQENKLVVELSQDCFHDDDLVSQWVVDYWTRRAAHRHSHYAIRNVSHNVAAQGRAKRTGSGWGEHCVCSTHIIRPDGKIKLCGCTNAPVIGDVVRGIEARWETVMRDNEHYQDTECYQSIKGRRF